MDLVYSTPQRIDSSNAGELQNDLSGILTDNQPGEGDRVVIDMSETTYISSAGLRVILSAYKKMKASGVGFTLTNVCAGVLDVFDVTGMSGFLPME